MAFCGIANAQPVGGVVTTGSGHIGQAGNTTTITQGSQSLGINWQSFNIAANQTVNFVQPNSQAIAINRILGSNGSQIDGHLNANGQVYLLNPNGILFGKGSQVNVGGLVASTLDSLTQTGNTVSLSGNGKGSIVNQGTIHADRGTVALIGNQVTNSGTITAQLGTVALAGGSAVTLTFNGNGVAAVRVDRSLLDALASNGGLIQADGGQVILTAGARDAILASAVNNSGIIEAQTVQSHAGQITLLGGMSQGTVNVTGTLDASAPSGGNGGKIETSANQVKIGNNAIIMTSAPQGIQGSWLIDPNDFTIAASGGDIIGAALNTALSSNSVTIQTTATTASCTGATCTTGTTGSGDIFVNDAVSWNSSSILTLNAYRNININSSITSSGTGGGVALLYGQGAVKAGNTATYNVNAPVNLAQGNSFSTTLGSDGTAVNYTVIDSLGVSIDASVQPATMSLQGIMATSASLSGNYVLGANIDASATSGWNSNAGFEPIGNISKHFIGTFDGLGHTISNLTINRAPTSYVGPFGISSGAIRNVGLVGGSVTGSGLVGGLVGWNYGGTISNSYATGPVTGHLSAIGGLVGYNYGSISNSYATGSVTGSIANSTGGLVGVNDYTSTISNSYATGLVMGSNYVGGLVGSSYGTISNSYATGLVTGSGLKIYGLVGNNHGTINNSYWDTQTSGQSTSSGATGLTTAQMQTASNFGGFNFTTTPGATGNNWVMVDVDGTLNNSGGALGATFPMLASEYSTTINNAHQLQLTAMNLAGSYTLGQNIDASNTNTATTLKDIWSTTGGFAPIGNTSKHFIGTFDGLGHTISNLTINLPLTSYVGLFGVSSGAIRNVGLVGGGVTGKNYTGGLVGYNIYGTISNSYATGSVTAGTGSTDVGGLVGFNYGGTISNSYATGSVTGSNVGGLVGYDSGGTISNSYATGSVTGNSYIGSSYAVGGLVGESYSNGTISNSYATGAVVSGSNYVGGLVGYNTLTISNSYATGAVTGGSNVGGLVGYNTNTHTISNSYATGSVTGDGIATGGLVGSSSGTISNSYATGAVLGGNNVGGLVGLGSSSGTISNSYATGAVSGGSNSNYVGGLVGNNTGTITTSYWNSSVNSLLPGVGAGTSTGASPLTTTEMQTQAKFFGFDFTTPVWGIVPGVNYGMPILCVFGGCAVATTTVYVDPVTGSSIYGSAPAFTYTLVNGSGTLYSLTNATLN